MNTSPQQSHYTAPHDYYYADDDDDEAKTKKEADDDDGGLNQNQVLRAPNPFISLAFLAVDPC